MAFVYKRFFPLFAVLLSTVLLHAPASLADWILAGSEPHPLRFSGKFIELKTGVVSILENDGTLIKIDWNAITAIDIVDPVFVTFATDERVFGLVRLENGRVRIHSVSLGIMESTSDGVVAIERRKRVISAELAASPHEMSGVRGKGTHASSIEKEGQGRHEDSQARIDEPGKDVTTIGEKEEKRPEETFVRAEKVHLLGGQIETEFGVSYYDYDHQSDSREFRDRRLFFPFTLRYGLTDRLSAMFTLPLAAGWREIPENGKTESHDNSGFGDLSFGLQYQILTERVARPDLMFILQAGSDTGEGGPQLIETQPPLGSGFWRINPGFTIVKTVDPVVLFGGLSYTHFFEDSGFQPGEAINTVLGTGFAANDEVALSFRLDGSYLSRAKYRGREYRTILTPYTFYFALDKYITNKSYLEPR